MSIANKKYAGVSNSLNNQNNGKAAKVPIVPGANGNNPTPPEKAMKYAGWLSAKAKLGLNATALFESKCCSVSGDKVVISFVIQ